MCITFIRCSTCNEVRELPNPELCDDWHNCGQSEYWPIPMRQHCHVCNPNDQQASTTAVTGERQQQSPVAGPSRVEARAGPSMADWTVAGGTENDYRIEEGGNVLEPLPQVTGEGQQQWIGEGQQQWVGEEQQHATERILYDPMIGGEIEDEPFSEGREEMTGMGGGAWNPALQGLLPWPGQPFAHQLGWDSEQQPKPENASQTDQRHQPLLQQQPEQHQPQQHQAHQRNLADLHALPQQQPDPPIAQGVQNFQTRRAFERSRQQRSQRQQQRRGKGGQRGGQKGGQRDGQGSGRKGGGGRGGGAAAGGSA